MTFNIVKIKKYINLNKYIIISLLCLILFIYVIYKDNEYFNNYNNNDINNDINNIINIDIKSQKHNLIFTSAGDNTQFYNHWLGENRNYDVWCVYYGNNDETYNMYEGLVDKIWKRKGSKFQNFHHIYTNYKELLDKYDRFFIVDDDIVISTNDINNLFDISIKYDLWVCQPSFTEDSKISSPFFNKVILGNYLRYVNFIEVGVPVFSKEALYKFMAYYDPILIGWGIDLLYMWVLGLEKENKYAIIDIIQCINPHDAHKNNKNREHTNIENHNNEVEYWLQIKNKYNIPDWKGNQTFSTILESQENKINNLKLGIQTVLLIKENLPFLREWIIYHLHIGFDKIFLYDNTGSIGIDSSNKTMNKYAFNFNTIINMNEDLVNNELQSILNDFKDNVIYVQWQPKDDKGNIIYGQTEAIKHYIENYKDSVDYTAYTDIDEFIFSVNNINLKQYIYDLSKDNITKIIIKQKKFADRFCNKELKNSIDITNTIENLDTNGWAPKIIIKNNDTNIENISNIHSILNINGKTKEAPVDTLRFNHYNVNKKQIEWMKDFYNKQSIDNFTYGHDNTFNRYSNIIKIKCNNKCSNNTKFININEIIKDYDNLCVAKW